MIINVPGVNTTPSAAQIPVSDEVKKMTGALNVDEALKAIYGSFSAIGIPKRNVSGAPLFNDDRNLYKSNVEGTASGKMSDRILIDSFSYTISKNATFLYFNGYAAENAGRGANIWVYINGTKACAVGYNGYKEVTYEIPEDLKGKSVNIELKFQANLESDQYKYNASYKDFSMKENDIYEL